MGFLVGGGDLACPSVGPSTENVGVSEKRMTDPGGFAEMFRQEFPRLAAYCAGLVADRELGADLAQEALARTWARWPEVVDPHAYAYLVATNLVRGYWKTRSRDQQARSVLSWQLPSSESMDEGVRDLVERLPERLRIPTLLHYYADLSVNQVARLLHRPKGTIRQRLHEARRLLAHQLNQEDRQ